MNKSWSTKRGVWSRGTWLTLNIPVYQSRALTYTKGQRSLVFYIS